MDISTYKIEDLLHYKIAYMLKGILKNKDHQNIIVSGLKSVGKTTLITVVMRNIFGETKLCNRDKISFLENKNYYIFDLLKANNKYDILKLIKDITNKYDYYSNNRKYIILDNFNDTSQNIQNSIKVLIEKNSINARFILITKKYQSINKSLSANCLQLKIPNPTKYDKFIYLQDIFKNKIRFNRYLLLEDCSKLDIEIIMNKYLFDCEYKDIYIENIYNFIEFLLSDLNISFLRDHIINVKNTDLKIDLFLNKLIDKLVPILSGLKMIIVIKEISKYNYIINKSYRDIIPLEALFIRLYKIINYERLL